MPGGFKKIDLFRVAPRKLRQQAQREIENTQLGRLIKQLRGAFHRSSRTAAVSPSSPLHQALTQFKRSGPERALRELMGTEIGRLLVDVQRYSRGEPSRQVVNEFLASLGPVGSLLQSIVRTAGGRRVERSLDAAMALLRSFGYEVLPPKPKKATPQDLLRGIESARSFLEGLGFDVISPEQRKQRERERRAGGPRSTRTSRPGELPFDIPATTTRGEPRRTVELPIEGRQRFPVDHPIVTGEMIPTPESSNVHSFGYDVEHAYLYIRFKAPASPGQESRPQSPGPIYRYHNVPARIFLAMLDAPSKGTFIWDRIRERGTLSGHQYDYALVGVTNGYVPRKATLRATGEWFMPREVMTDRGRTLTSERGEQLVRPLMPMRGLPNNGTGGINRGTPRRGR